MNRISDEAVVQMKDAYEAGAAWAKGLAVGDQFRGALVEGAAQYPPKQPGPQGMRLPLQFMSGALDVFDKERVKLHTDQEGIITKIERAG